MKMDKQTTTILGVIGVGALIYYFMNKPTTKSDSKTENTDKSSGKTIREKINFYFPQSKDARLAKQIESQFMQGGKMITEEQFMDKINAQIKEMGVEESNKQMQAELDAAIKNAKTSQELDKLVKDPELRKLSITKEQIQKLADSKETLLIKSLISSMVMMSVLAIQLSSPNKMVKVTKENTKSETQLTEAKEFLGMCNY